MSSVNVTQTDIDSYFGLNRKTVINPIISDPLTLLIHNPEIFHKIQQKKIEKTEKKTKLKKDSKKKEKELESRKIEKMDSLINKKITDDRSTTVSLSK
jgi:hypothetical protein